jgi:hypothetical protein
MNLGKTSWLAELVEEKDVHLMAHRKHREKKGPETIYNLQRHGPNDLCLPYRPHLVKFLAPPKVAPPTRD